MSALDDLVAVYESAGSRRADRELGFQVMPADYALMIDADGVFYFWLREDGAESAVHWSKWAVWRGAILDAAGRLRGYPDELPSDVEPQQSQI